MHPEPVFVLAGIKEEESEEVNAGIHVRTVLVM